MDNLRGDPHELILVPHTRVTGSREDGTPKALGYFGAVAMRDDPESYTTELPYKIGTGWWIPLVVPTLTRAELTHLAAGGRPTDEILDKARGHANDRTDQGLPAFADLMEVPHDLPQ